MQWVKYKDQLIITVGVAALLIKLFICKIWSIWWNEIFCYLIDDINLYINIECMILTGIREVSRQHIILLYKVVRIFCLLLKITITTEVIGISINCKLYIGPIMVLSYFISDLSLGMVWNNFLAPWNAEFVDPRGASASM